MKFATLLFYCLTGFLAACYSQASFPRWTIGLEGGYSAASYYMGFREINAARDSYNAGIYFGRMLFDKSEIAIGFYYEQGGYEVLVRSQSQYRETRAVDYLANYIQIRYYPLLDKGLFIATGIYDALKIRSYSESRKKWDYGVHFSTGYRKVFRNKFGVELSVSSNIGVINNGDTSGKNFTFQSKLGLLRVF